MKRFLHFAISYLLIMTSLPVMAKTFNDPDLQKAYDDCQGNTAKYWDNETNRCLNTEITERQREAYQQCEELPLDERQACHERVASDATGVFQGDGQDAAADGSDNRADQTMSSAISGIYSLYLIISYWGQNHKAAECTSKRIFNVASIANVVLDIYLKKKAEDEFDEMADGYEKETKEFFENDESGISQSYEAQHRAFQYLKQEQELVASLAKKRAQAYMALGIAYTAALGFAIYEMVSPTAIPCINAGEANKDGTANTEQQSAIKEAGTDSTAQTPYGAVTGFGGGGSSAGIAIASGVMLGLNVKLMSAAKETESDAEDNAKKIQEVMDGFKQALADFCPNGREDLAEPRCYCYTESGDKNPNRTKSDICKNLWAEDEKSYMAGAGDYSKKTGPAEGCMTVNNKYDADCRCKKMINTETKQNACMKTNFGPALISGPFGNTALANTAGLLNRVPSGANQFIDQVGSSGDLGAAKINKITDAILGKEAKKFGIPSTRDAFGRLADKAVKNTPKPLLQRYGGSSVRDLASSRRPKSANMEAAITKASKKAGLKKAFALSGGKGSLGLTKGKKRKGKYKFSWNDSGNAGKVEEFNAADQPEYKYNQKQINDNDSVSLWEVISHRYSTSGMRRLFSEEVE